MFTFKGLIIVITRADLRLAISPSIVPVESMETSTSKRRTSVLKLSGLIFPFEIHVWKDEKGVCFGSGLMRLYHDKLGFGLN